MKRDRIEGNCKQIKGNVRQQWGKLAEDQPDGIAGKRDFSRGKVQQAYRISKGKAEKQLLAWQKM